MAKPNNIPLGYEEFTEVTDGAMNAYLRNLQEDPKAHRRAMRQLALINSRLALRIVAEGRESREAGLSAEEAYVAGAMFVIGSLVTQAEGDRLNELFAATAVAPPHEQILEGAGGVSAPPAQLEP